MKVFKLLILVLISSVSLFAKDSELRFIDGRFIDLIATYEQATEKDLVADLEYSYPVNFSSHEKLSEQRVVEVLEVLMTIQGVELLEREGKVHVVRQNEGEFLSGHIDDVQTRLSDTLRSLPDDYIIGHIEIKNESLVQALNLFGRIADKPLIRGPGAATGGHVNLKLSNVSARDALLAFDEIFLRHGIVVSDYGEGLMKVLIRKPRELHKIQLSGMGVFERRSAVPVVRETQVE